MRSEDACSVDAGVANPGAVHRQTAGRGAGAASHRAAVGLAALCACTLVHAGGQCRDPGEVSFNFPEIEVKDALALLADFAKLRTAIDPSISASEPMRFRCRRWDAVARDLADRHNLKLEIRDGVLYVSRK